MKIMIAESNHNMRLNRHLALALMFWLEILQMPITMGFNNDASNERIYIMEFVVS